MIRRKLTRLVLAAIISVGAVYFVFTVVGQVNSLSPSAVSSAPGQNTADIAVIPPNSTNLTPSKYKSMRSRFVAQAMLSLPHVSADKLSTDYARSKLTSDMKYKSKLMVVTGTVASIKMAYDGWPCVEFAPNGGFQTVCALAPNAVEDLAGLHTGSRVSISGTCHGTLVPDPSLGNRVAVLMSGCSIL